MRADAPRLGPEPDTPVETVCIHCVVDEWSDIGRGLDLPREHGAAELEADGEWKAGREE